MAEVKTGPRAGSADRVSPVDRIAVLTRGTWVWLRGVTGWQWLLVAMITWYVWVMTAMSLDAHHGLGTSAYDLGIFKQGLWLVSNFEAPFVTLRGLHLFGDHASFVMLFMVPVYWLFPTAGSMLFIQSLAIGAGALPVFLYARRRLGGEAVALLFAAIYLLHPAVSWTNMFEFHPDAFFGVFVGFAIYGALTERWRVYTVFMVLTLLVKEDAALIVIGLGVWVAWRRALWIGVLTLLWSVAYLVFVVAIAMFYLSGITLARVDRIPFGGPIGFVRTGITEPGRITELFVSESRLFYAWQMLSSVGWGFVRLPDVAAIGILVFLANLVSVHGYQHSIQFHYSLVLVPPLVLGTVHAIGAVRRYRRQIIGGVALAALWASFLWGTLPFARDPRVFNPPDHPVAVAARQIMESVPDDASVSAHHRLTPHLANRTDLYHFPNPFHVHYYGPGDDVIPGGTRLRASDEIEYVLLRTPLTEDLQLRVWGGVLHDFELVEANDYWRLYRRVGLEG